MIGIVDIDGISEREGMLGYCSIGQLGVAGMRSRLHMP